MHNLLNCLGCISFLVVVSSVEISVKTIPEQYEAGKQLLIQWDISHGETGQITATYLYLRQHNEDVQIAAHDDSKLNDEGVRLLGDRLTVSIGLDNVNITIHKLDYNDNYQFTVLASGGDLSQLSSVKNETFIVKALKDDNKTPPKDDDDYLSVFIVLSVLFLVIIAILIAAAVHRRTYILQRRIQKHGNICEGE